MADTTEVREVRTDFTGKDAGFGATIARLGNAYEASSQKLSGLRSRFADFRKETGLNTAAVLGVGVGLGAWIMRAKEANAEFEGTKKSLAGVLSGALKFDKGTSELERYNRALVLSKGITGELDDISSRFVVGLDDVSQTYRTLVGATGRYGSTQKQVMGLTEQSVALAKRFGVSGSQSAMAISRALEKGTVTGFGPFEIALRNTLGNMTKLTQAQRFEHVQRALKGSVAIADAMSAGLSGSLARIGSTVNDTIRELSTPLFAEIAKTIEGWAKSLKMAKEHGKPLIDVYADRLVSAFRELKALSQFIREHWVAIAALAVGMKGGGALGSLGGFLSGIGAKGSKGAGPVADLQQASGALGGFLSTAGRVAPAFGGIIAAAGLAAAALKGVYDEWRTRKQAASEMGGFFDEVGKVARAQRDIQKFGSRMGPEDHAEAEAFAKEHAGAAAEILKQKGLLDEQGVLNRERFNQVMDSMSDDVRLKFAENFKGMLGDVSSGMLGAFAAETFAKNYVAERAGADDTNRPLAKSIQNFYGGIHMTMKVEDSDPDRVFVRFEEGFNNMVDRRSQALSTEPQGP